MTAAFLGIGSSLGDRLHHLQRAVDRLNRPETGVLVRDISPVYESPHLGLHAEDARRYPPHLNAVVHVETSLSAAELLAVVHGVEEAGHRQRVVRWGPRTIDIDILLYGDEVVETDDLRIPHPGLAERAFVLRPLADLAPDLVLPDGRRLTELVADAAIWAQVLELHGKPLRLPADTL